MLLQDLSDQLTSSLQGEQLILSESSLTGFSLSGVFELLNVLNLTLLHTTLTLSEDSLIISGKSPLFGQDLVGLTLTITDAPPETSFTIEILSVPRLAVPGASWLTMTDASIVLTMQPNTAEVSGEIRGRITIEDSGNTTTFGAAIRVAYENSQPVFDWELSQISVTQIATLALDGVTLPSELPNIAFSTVGMHLEPRTGDFALTAQSTEAWMFPAQGGGLTLNRVDFRLHRTASGESLDLGCRIALGGQAPLTVVPEIQFRAFDFIFELENRDWRLEGSLAATLFDTQVALSAAYAQTEETQVFQLRSESNVLDNVLVINGVADLDLSELIISYTQSVGTGAASWEVATSGQLQIQDVLTTKGGLTFAKDGAGESITFEPEEARVRLLLPPETTNQAAMVLNFGGITIERQRLTTGSSWSFEAAVDLSFENWHPEVQKVLPDTIQATFAASQEAVSLTASRVVAPVDYRLPAISIEGLSQVELGSARIDVTDLSITLSDEIELSADLNIGLPSKLNNMFGTDNGQPKLEFFNTFDPADPDNPDNLVRLELAINSVDGIRLIPRNSPIQAIRLVEEGDKTFWYVDMQTFGEVKLQVPELSYDVDSTSFKASGGFEVVRPLALPLTPAQELLKAAGLKPAAESLPESIPLKGIDIVDDRDNFKIDEFLQLLGLDADDLPQEVEDAIDLVGDRLDDLPDSFKRFLNIEIPKSFYFDIGISPSGEVRLDIRVNEGDPPVKLFFATPLPIPTLNGIELRSLSFGVLSGGSLFLLEVDAVINQFDLLTLAGALVLPDSLPLPDSQSLHRRLILNKLFMIIVYQTVIPIPIPIFYDQIGIEYLGLEGINFETHAEFPMPSINLVEIGKLLANFQRFFADKDYLLDPNQPPEDFNLVFRLPLETNFLKLPEYLGSRRLGSDDEGIELDLYANLAHLLNGLKTFSVNELIQTMPFQHRVGQQQVKFGPVTLQTSWVLTTPDEFRQLVTSRTALPEGLASNGLLSVPPSNRRQEEGLIALLQGSWQVSNLAAFETTFGLAAAGSTGFQTAFRMSGSIASTLSMSLEGQVAVAAPRVDQDGKDAFRLAGRSRVRLANHAIFAGDIQLSDSGFSCAGTLDLWTIKAEAQMTVNDQGAEIRGQLAPINLLNGSFVLSKASVEVAFSARQLPRLKLDGAVRLLGISSTTGIVVDENGFLFTTQGKIFNVFSGKLTVRGGRLDHAAGFRVTGQMQIDLLNYLEREVTQLINSSVNAATAELRKAQQDVDAAQRTVNQLDSTVNQQRDIVNREREAATRELRSADKKVKSAEKEVNGLKALISDRVRKRDEAAGRQSCHNTFFGRVCVPDPSGPIEAGRWQAEIIGLQTSLTTAQGGLAAARLALDVARRAVNTTPVEVDPRVAGPLAALTTANATLEAAEGVLRGAELATGAFGSISTYITRHGLEALLDVHSAQFDVELSNAQRSGIEMRIALSYLGQPQTLQLSLNFGDPIKSAQNLANQLLPG